MERLCALENSADAHRGLSNAHNHRAERAAREADTQEWLGHTEIALQEAQAAIDISPNDRLARWHYLCIRNSYLNGRRALIPPEQAEAFAQETVEKARVLAAMDPADFTMHSVLDCSLSLTASLSEACGHIAQAQALREEDVRECRRICFHQPQEADAKRALENATRARDELLSRYPAR
jgi:hypothetical protein